MCSAKSGCPLCANSRHRTLAARSLRTRWNDRRTRPVFRKNLHNQNAKRLVCLVCSAVCARLPGLKIIVASLIDRRNASLSEGELARKNISNPGPNMVMHSKVGPGGKRKFGGPHFELTVELGQVAEGDPPQSLITDVMPRASTFFLEPPSDQLRQAAPRGAIAYVKRVIVLSIALTVVANGLLSANSGRRHRQPVEFVFRRLLCAEEFLLISYRADYNFR